MINNKMPEGAFWAPFLAVLRKVVNEDGKK